MNKAPQDITVLNRFGCLLLGLLVVCADNGCTTHSASPPQCCSNDISSGWPGLNSLLVQKVPVRERQGDALADIGFRDQRAAHHDASTLTGKPLALSFIYTRCENINRCPAITRSMIELQQRIDNSGLSQKMNVALVSFDPLFDTPEKLAAYAEASGVEKKSHLLFLTPNLSQKTEFFKRIRLPVNYEESGRPNGHGTLLLLLDKQGRIAERREVVISEIESIFQSLQELAKE